MDETRVHCYICADSSLMGWEANSRKVNLRRSRYLWAPVLLVVFALSASVATRTSVLSLSHGASVSEQSASGMRQHMDSDGEQWVPPVATVIIAALVFSFYPRFAPAGPPLPSTLFDESLYNRPPPAC